MMGRLEGAAFVVDSQGRSYVPGAKVVLQGPTKLERETDAEGKCVFADVVPGTYAIDVHSGALQGSQSVTVQPGVVTQFALELKPAAVNSSMTVSDTTPEVQAAAPSQTITSNIVTEAPNKNDRTESLLPLIPGVVRGPDGRINMKGARNTQSGALVNSANATDPATGAPGVDVPIDVVQSVQVISNPYDPQYGKLTGAVSTVDTKTGDYTKLHFSIQNVMPRMRVREGTVLGIGGATPRVTVTGPLLDGRLAFTQSIEYRFVRTPVNSLPATKRDTTLQGVNSFTQFDAILSPRQTATVSFALYPQKLQDMGLNTFTPQTSTPDYHQRGYEFYAQHRYVIEEGSLLTSQFSYQTFDADIIPKGSSPYRLLTETTEGSYFQAQSRRSSRADLQEIYELTPWHLFGIHQSKVGLNYAHSSYDARQSFLPVEIDGDSGAPIERVNFTGRSAEGISQDELSGFLSDQWSILPRITFDPGLRFDKDSITHSTHVAPRAGFQLALTADRKTLLKGGAGVFYDRVPLMIPSFPSLPDRTVSYLDPLGQVTAWTFYRNQIEGKLRNPRSTALNVALSRQVLEGLTLQIAFERRRTKDDFLLSPGATGNSGTLSLENGGRESYREVQISGRYQFRQHTFNASYVRSKAYGDLNDFFQFYGNMPKPIVQTNGQGRLPYDAPNRVLLWGEFKMPWKLTLLPVFDMHTGFPYSVQDELRDCVGPRNSLRFPRFASTDLQILRPVKIPFGSRRIKARLGVSVFNLFNHFNPRDVQDIAESPRFGEFSNDAWREYRGKFVFEF